MIGREGVDVDAPSEFGATPLHIACLKGHLAAALLLLENYADREARDKRSRTPLFEAVCAGHDKFVDAMSSHDVMDLGRLGPFEVNAVADDGTPLLMAAVETH